MASAIQAIEQAPHVEVVYTEEARIAERHLDDYVGGIVMGSLSRHVHEVDPRRSERFLTTIHVLQQQLCSHTDPGQKQAQILGFDAGFQKPISTESLDAMEVEI